MSDKSKSKKEIDIEKLKEELKKEVLDEIKNEKNKDDKKIEEKAKEAIDKIMDTEDNTKEHDKKDIEANKAMAILSYIGPLCLIPFFASKESKFAQFHAKQGLNLCIIEIAVAILSHFLTSIFEIKQICNIGNIEYVCGVNNPLWITIPMNFVQIIIGIIALIGLIYACQGKAKELPIFGKIKIIK